MWHHRSIHRQTHHSKLYCHSSDACVQPHGHALTRCRADHFVPRRWPSSEQSFSPGANEALFACKVWSFSTLRAVMVTHKPPVPSFSLFHFSISLMMSISSFSIALPFALSSFSRLRSMTVTLSLHTPLPGARYAISQVSASLLAEAFLVRQWYLASSWSMHTV